VVPDALTGGPRFAAFCEHYVRHTKGRWAGRPVILEGWEREFWWEALEVDPATGLRIYNEVGLGIPTKNGKSTQAACCGYYFLLADGENEPEVIVGAAARHQAGIVLGQMRSMGRRSPELARLVHVQTVRIDCPRNDGIVRAVASDGVLQHGPNPSCNIIDEIHAHRDSGLYTALTKSGGAREQPFTLWISTAGPDLGGVLAALYQQMFDGPGELELRGDSLRIYRDRVNGVLIYWYGAPKDADIEDPAVWLRANPASWLQDGRFLRREFTTLRSRGELLAWRMYHLNQLVGHEGTWLPVESWALGIAPDVPLNVALPVGVGVFKTAASDAASIAVAQKQGERVVLTVRTFGAEAETGRVSTEEMRIYLRELRGRFPLPQMTDVRSKRPIPGPAIAFERWSFAESAGELDQEGLNMVDFPQVAGSMGPASTQAYELITSGRLLHEADPVLEEHLGATNAVLTDRGMRAMPRREGPVQNHAAIAAIMATAMAMLEPPAPAQPATFYSF
jgi:phage terminase large subunit-like protein